MCVPHPSFLLGGVEPATKFSKRRGGGHDRTSPLRGGAGKEGGNFFGGGGEGCNFYKKTKLKYEIFNGKKSL